jgi:hypothetical protein
MPDPSTAHGALLLLVTGIIFGFGFALGELVVAQFTTAVRR